MELREATADDFEAITRLITTPAELFRVYPKGHYPLTVAQLQALAEVRRDLTVATERGAVFGFANLYDVHPGHYAFVGNVIVAQSHRGRGLGRGLVSHMISMALRNYALQEVRISVFSDNIPALLMYRALGFHPPPSRSGAIGRGGGSPCCIWCCPVRGGTQCRMSSK